MSKPFSDTPTTLPDPATQSGNFEPNHASIAAAADSTEGTQREQQLVRWLQGVFRHQDFTMDSLLGDASARRYHRLQLTDANGGEPIRYMVMDSAAEKDAMCQFINVAKLMAPAINVPTLIAQDIEQGFLVLQDFGSTEFAHLLVDATPQAIDRYYQQALQTLVALQRIPVATAQSEHHLPSYDRELLAREMDLFSEWFIPFVGAKLDRTLWDNLKSVLIEAILAQPQVIVHRDYHSRNLMQDDNDATRLGVIDFQDAVIGAYSYDLVSLVRDAYVDWPESQVSQWIGEFWQMQQQAGLTTAASAQAFEADVNVMGAQRHLKVLGIFIRLSKRDGKDRYLADIPKVTRDLLFELEWLSTHGDAAMKGAVQPFYAWLQTHLLPAYQRSFTQ